MLHNYGEGSELFQLSCGLLERGYVSCYWMPT